MAMQEKLIISLRGEIQMYREHLQTLLVSIQRYPIKKMDPQK